MKEAAHRRDRTPADPVKRESIGVASGRCRPRSQAPSDKGFSFSSSFALRSRPSIFRHPFIHGAPFCNAAPHTNLLEIVKSQGRGTEA